MTAKRALCLAGAALCAVPLLSGCVAAAIPVLAASGVLGTQLKDKTDDDNSVQRGQPRVAIDMSPTTAASVGNASPTGGPAPGAYSRNYTLADGTRMEVLAGPVEPANGAETLPAATAPAASPASLPSSPLPASTLLPPASAGISSSYTLDDGTYVRLVSAMPAPSGAVMAPVGTAGYDAFYAFAAREGTLPVAGSDRRSAMLERPGTLEPATRRCSVHPAAVLIDLDPVGGVLDPATATHAEPRLAGTLAGLRGEGIAIAWTSAITADRAGAVRRALIASGLDPAGRDVLALLRYPEERKQTRREDFAKEFCVVAIAGDDRGDFDELFHYLKDPALAVPLDSLIGNGWFLIPQPLS